MTKIDCLDCKDILNNNTGYAYLRIKSDKEIYELILQDSKILILLTYKNSASKLLFNDNKDKYEISLIINELLNHLDDTTIENIILEKDLEIENLFDKIIIYLNSTTTPIGLIWSRLKDLLFTKVQITTKLKESTKIMIESTNNMLTFKINLSNIEFMEAESCLPLAAIFCNSNGSLTYMSPFRKEFEVSLNELNPFRKEDQSKTINQNDLETVLIREILKDLIREDKSTEIINLILNNIDKIVKV